MHETQSVLQFDENGLGQKMEGMSLHLDSQHATMSGNGTGDGIEVKPQKSLAELKRSLSDLSEKLGDIQSSLYEIQEYRHMSNKDTATSTTSRIDTLLPSFDTSLESFSGSISTLTIDISQYISSISPSSSGPITPGGGASGYRTANELNKRLRELQNDWAEMVESDMILKEELKEDKWLEVFRTAADQAEGMMDSLQKAVSQCSTLAFQITAPAGFAADFDVESVKSTISNYEAKKKFYQPSVTKSLLILEKGIKERITKNGETLRRHADMSDRWRSLRDEMALIDKQIPNLQSQLSNLSSIGDGRTEMLMDEREDTGYSSTLGSEIASSRIGDMSGWSSPRDVESKSRAVSSSAFNAGDMGMARNKSRSSSGLSGLSGLSGPRGVSTPSTTVTGSSKTSETPTSPQSEASSYFSNLRSRFTRKGNETPTSSVKPKWNSSSRIVESPTPSRIGTVDGKMSFVKKRSGIQGEGSRPGSPSPSAGRSISRATTPAREMITKPVPPPTPVGEHPPRRASSPTLTSVSSNTSMNRRRSMLPVLRTSTSSGSTPTRAQGLSQTGLYDSPPPLPPMPDMREISAKEAKAAYLRSGMMTPEPMLRERATRMPFYIGRSQVQGLGTPSRISNAGHVVTPGRTVSAPGIPITSGSITPGRGRSSLGPPSAFKDPSRPSSRATSRVGAQTPSAHLSMGTFIPNRLDALDMAIYEILQSIPNDIGVERVDPPLRRGQLHVGEWKGEYTFISGRVRRKMVGCRLLELNKPGMGGVMRKVMVKVNGVWVDLRFYVMELV